MTNVKTLVHYPMIMKGDGKWYHVAGSRWTLDSKVAEIAAKEAAESKGYRYKVKSVEAELDSEGNIY